mmetsp:Transcript_27080/g.89957  ORF Transcript_27080/g.89957 Transcript_27080/m.89957 type:complete len:262 (-) Transcript_27080:18-803(-)
MYTLPQPLPLPCSSSARCPRTLASILSRDQRLPKRATREGLLLDDQDKIARLLRKGRMVSLAFEGDPHARFPSRSNRHRDELGLLEGLPIRAQPCPLHSHPPRGALLQLCRRAWNNNLDRLLHLLLVQARGKPFVVLLVRGCQGICICEEGGEQCERVAHVLIGLPALVRGWELQPLLAELVVALPMQRVDKDVVGLCDIPEALLSFYLSAGVLLRVPLHGHAAVALSNLRRGRRAGHAEDAVVVPAHHCEGYWEVQPDSC